MALATPSNEILSSTLRILIPDAVDNLHRTTPIVSELEKVGGIEMVDGGSTYEHPIILAEHSNITQMATGYEPVSLSVTDALRTATYSWCDFVAPIVISRKEELSNKGPRAIVKIAEARMKSVLGTLKREMSLQLIRGTSTVLTELETLNGGSAAAGTGWLEFDPYGSQTNTVGGLNKATFPSWNNQTATASGAFATNGLRAMSRLMINCQVYAPEGDIKLILASPLSYELYKDQLQTQERYMAATEQRLDGGKLALAYNGALMHIEPNLGFTAADGNIFSMYFINPDLMKLVYDKAAKFEMSDFEHVSGHNSRSAQLQVRTQIAASHLGGLGALFNAEA